MTADTQTTPVGKRILFMDDEPHKPIVQELQTALEDRGHTVDFVTTMSAAIESYYQCFYDVFILDIDMGADPEDAAGDGVAVLKRLISLHNQTRVIIFSGAGTVRHWFEAANSHCFAYVAKDEKAGIDKVVRMVDAAAEAASVMPHAPADTHPPVALLLYAPDDRIDAVRGALDQIPGDRIAGLKLQIVAGLAEAQALVNAEPDRFFAVVLLQQNFNLWPETQNPLKALAARGNRPQIIFACQGGQEDEHKASVLFLANLHPFRMVNLDLPQWAERLTAAIQDAYTWYGQPEIFKADAAALQRLNITLPEDALAQWEDDVDDDWDETEAGY